MKRSRGGRGRERGLLEEATTARCQRCRSGHSRATREGITAVARGISGREQAASPLVRAYVRGLQFEFLKYICLREYNAAHRASGRHTINADNSGCKGLILLYTERRSNPSRRDWPNVRHKLPSAACTGLLCAQLTARTVHTGQTQQTKDAKECPRTE